MNSSIKQPKQSTRGRLFILSAPSGAGKTTLGQAIRSHFKDLHYSISYTTRSPRKGESQGKDYHFIQEIEFKKMIAADKWAEWAEVHGNYYGTSAGDIENFLIAGKDVLLDIDVQGAAQILKRYPDSVSIFIMPPSKAVLKSRLDKRGTDSTDVIQRRLDQADKEMKHRDHYRHVIVNDRLEDAIDALIKIISGYRASTGHHRSA